MHPQEVERNIEMSLDETSTNLDINVPLDLTENPLKWDGNNARILDHPASLLASGLARLTVSDGRSEVGLRSSPCTPPQP